ncbi:INO80 complex subunit B [Coemansia sp. RSA 2399]|nr:INO80 complex subunit B [Coemansia sp. RSA 2399]KAJ1904152.1 INO80 complex subunit B [Coemansia sp. IMI 209127]
MPSPTLSRGARRGSRGRRGRGRPPKLGSARVGSPARGTRKSARLDASGSEPSNTDTESTGAYSMAENDSADQVSNGESEDSTNDDESQAEDTATANAASESQSNTAQQDDDDDSDDDDEEEEEAKSESTDSNEMKESILGEEESNEANDTPSGKGKPDTSSRAKKGKSGRGPGRPKATEYASEDSEPNMYGTDGMEIDDSASFDFGDEDGGLELPSQANLTRRQRAKLTRDHDEELLELPVESKRSKFSAEEAALRKSEHARRRKFQSMQRAEQLKNDTINRLLNKQTSKGRNKVSEDAETRATSTDNDDDDEGEVSDRIRYTQRIIKDDADNSSERSARIECALSLPKGSTLKAAIPCVTSKGFAPKYPPPAPACSVQGCAQKKKYSVNSHAACSLEHWRILNTAAASDSK